MLEKLVAAYVKHTFEKGNRHTTKNIEVDGIYDVYYHEDHHPMHQLDYYYPKVKEKEKLPVIFYIHGGAWVAFDKDRNRSYGEYLAAYGYCVVNISYRLLPKTDLKGQLEDVKDALTYCMLHPIAQMDVNQLILMGDSAGAHLASTFYCIMKQKQSQDLYQIYVEDYQVKALLLQNMVSDLSVFSSSDRYIMKLLMRLLFQTSWKTSPYLHQASFLELAKDDLKHVPVFLITSEQDQLYPQSVKMMEYLHKHKWCYDSKIWKKEDREGLGHVFQVTHTDWEESKITYKKLFAWLDQICYENQKE